MDEQSEKPAMDLYMDKVRDFVREKKGSGNVIDVTTMLAVLLAEKEVRDFIVREASFSERLVGNMARTMAENAENTIRRIVTLRSSAGGAPESGEIGFYDNLDIVNAGPNFVTRSREGESAPRNRVEIFVALATAPELAFTTGEEPHSNHSVYKALGDLNLGDLRGRLLEIEYGTRDPDEIFRASPPREPTGKAIACVRDGKTLDEALKEAEKGKQKTPLALEMDRAAQPAGAEAEPTVPDAKDEEIERLVAALKDPEIVERLLANPKGREAIETIARKIGDVASSPGTPLPPKP